MFDPLDDVIDLRDAIAEAEAEMETRDNYHPALAFLGAMASDLGWNYTRSESVNRDAEIIETAREYADNEPTIIARRYFVEYVQDLASEVWGGPGRPPWEDNSWPAYCIDWEYAAKELEYDYSTFTYDGREYLIRSV